MVVSSEHVFKTTLRPKMQGEWLYCGCDTAEEALELKNYLQQSGIVSAHAEVHYDINERIPLESVDVLATIPKERTGPHGRSIGISYTVFVPGEEKSQLENLGYTVMNYRETAETIDDLLAQGQREKEEPWTDRVRRNAPAQIEGGLVYPEDKGSGTDSSKFKQAEKFSERPLSLEDDDDLPPFSC